MIGTRKIVKWVGKGEDKLWYAGKAYGWNTFAEYAEYVALIGNGGDGPIDGKTLLDDAVTGSDLRARQKLTAALNETDSEPSQNETDEAMALIPEDEANALFAQGGGSALVKRARELAVEGRVSPVALSYKDKDGAVRFYSNNADKEYFVKHGIADARFTMVP